MGAFEPSRCGDDRSAFDSTKRFEYPLPQLADSEQESEHLPAGLVVCGGLRISSCKLLQWPSEFRVGRSIITSNGALEALSKTLSLPGSLDISGTAVSKRPERLHIGSALIITDCPKRYFHGSGPPLLADCRR